MARQIDPRGQQFAAVLTCVVLVIVLVTSWWWLLAAQAVVFAIGAFAGLRFAPYGLIYKLLVRRFLGPPAQTEDEAPPRFAQLVGFVFAVVGTLGYVFGVPVVGIVASAFALLAAFLNAAFGLCLGCEMYVLGRRLLPSKRAAKA